MEKNQRHVTESGVMRHLEDHIRWVEDSIATIEREIAQMIHDNEAWREKERILRSVSGIGAVAAFTLVAELPELGHVNRQKIAVPVRLVPYNNDSGFKNRKRHIFGSSRAAVQQAPYMAALVATRTDPVIREFYECLLQRGKEKKVALTACMRKLLVILNAMVRDGTPCQAQSQPALPA